MQHVDELVGRRRALRRRLGDPALEARGPLAHRGREQVVLRREVAVDRGQRDVGRGRDVSHLDGVVPAVGAQLEGSVDHAPAPLELLGAQLGRDLEVLHRG
jgi:hypothetical protein